MCFVKLNAFQRVMRLWDAAGGVGPPARAGRLTALLALERENAGAIGARTVALVDAIMALRAIAAHGATFDNEENNDAIARTCAAHGIESGWLEDLDPLEREVLLQHLAACSGAGALVHDTPPTAATARTAAWQARTEHGGAFVLGSASLPQFDGERLASQGLLVVTHNYRLGPFGFFAHPELSRESGANASGNYALMDFDAVLRWVERNISEFGGDPKRVTIAGQSAGGVLVMFALTSFRVEGRFHRAILQSAPVRINTYPGLAEAERTGAEAGQKLG